MQLLDGLIRVLDGCAGLLEVLTIFLVGVAIYLGVRTYEKQKHLAEKLAHHHAKTPIKTPTWWPFAITLTLALIFTALAVYKWTLMIR
jgi:hypothetical protein